MTRRDESDKALKLIKRQLEKSDNRDLIIDSDAFTQWKLETEGILDNIFGEDSRQLNNFRSAFAFGYTESAWETKREREGKARERRKSQIGHATAVLKAVLLEVKNFGIPRVQQTPKIGYKLPYEGNDV